MSSAEQSDQPSRPAEPTTAAREGRSIRLPRPLALGLAVLLVLSLAGSGLLGVLLARRVATERAAAEALATARAYAATVTSYDYQRLDQDFANVLDGATGEFAAQYSGASQTLRELITQAKASAKGTVLDAGVRSASTDQVEVLVFVDQAVTNAVAPRPRIDRNRVLMTLTRHDDRWLVSKLELL